MLLPGVVEEGRSEEERGERRGSQYFEIVNRMTSLQIS